VSSAPSSGALITCTRSNIRTRSAVAAPIADQPEDTLPMGMISFWTPSSRLKAAAWTGPAPP